MRIAQLSIRIAVVLMLMHLALPPTALGQATGPFNVRSYGATGINNCTLDVNGFTTDTKAFNLALSNVPSSGGEIYIPAGTYCLSHSVSVNNKPIAFRGDGIRMSFLRWIGGSDGLQFATNTTGHTLTVSSLSIHSGVAGRNAAIYGAWPALSTALSATITDVEVFSQGGGDWTYGILLLNGSNARISKVAIKGTGFGTAAIRFAGLSIFPIVADSYFEFYPDGVLMTDSGEGLHVRDSEFVGQNRGVVIDSSSPRPGTTIHNNHFATSVKGVYLWQHGDVAISNNLIYATPQATNFMGIHAIHSDALRITGNYITRLNTNGNNGIVIEGTSPNLVISNNVTEGMHTGIWLTGPGVSGSIITGNLNKQVLVATILDWSGGLNVINNNF